GGAVDRVVDGLGEARPHLGSVAVADGLDDEVAEGLAFELKLAQHVEDLAAQSLPRLFELLQKATIDVALPRLRGDEIPEVANFGLPDAVDAAEALLEAIRIPRQVVVHHQVRALEVDALARSVGRDQHAHFGI